MSEFRKTQVPTEQAAPRVTRRRRTWAQDHRDFSPITRLPKVEEWPASHQAAWKRACFQAGPLDPPGRLVHLGPGARDEVRKAWARLVSFLTVTDERVPSEPPEDCLTQERFVAFLPSLRQRVSARTLRGDIQSLYYAINAMAPERDWQWVRSHPSRPREAEVRAGRKPIVPPDPVLLLAGALDFCDAMDRLPRGGRNSIRYRDGVIVALATLFAIRRENLAEIVIGEHLIIDDDAMRLKYEDSVKNGEIIDSLVPELLRPYMARYIDHHREVLLRHHPDVPELWIAWDGRPLCYGGLHFVFHRMGLRLIGRPLNPHIVRHAAATTILDNDPHNTEIASAALAHVGTSSVERVYDRSGPSRANRIWAKARRLRSRKR